MFSILLTRFFQNQLGDILSKFNVLIGLDEIFIILIIQRQGPQQYDHETHFFHE